MNIKVKLEPGAIMPKKAHDTDAGFDLFCPMNLYVAYGTPIDTGVHMEIPKGYCGLVVARSSIYKTGVDCMGVIDSDYRGTIKVVLNAFRKDCNKWYWQKGQRIAQLLIVAVPEVHLEEVTELSETDRGDGGFGSTGA